MNENDLREMFRRREGDFVGQVGVPLRISRRVRGTQARTIAVALATTLAVLGASFAGYRALTDRTGTYVPAEHDRHEISASASAIVITYPRSWQLTIDEARPGTLPADALTNFPLDPSAADLCAAMPPDGVLLVVTPGMVLPGPGSPPAWPVSLDARPAPAHCSANADSGTSWSTVGGLPFVAQAFLGPRAADQDLRLLQNAFRGMAFPAPDNSVSVEGVVLDTGLIAGRPWTLAASPDPQGPRLELGTSQGGGGLVSSASSPLRLTVPTDLVLNDDVMHGSTFLFGGVPGDTRRVVVAPDGSAAFDVPLLSIPSVLRGDARAFVAPMLGAPTGIVTTYDSEGRELTRAAFAPGVACWPGNPCQGQASSGGLIAEDTTGNIKWQLVTSDGRIRLVDGAGNVLGSVDAGAEGLTVDAPVLGSGDAAVTFPFGVAPQGSTYIVLFESGLPSDAQTATLDDGRLVFWAPFTPPDDRGQILAFDRSCTLLGAVDLQGQPVSRPATTACSP